VSTHVPDDLPLVPLDAVVMASLKQPRQSSTTVFFFDSKLCRGLVILLFALFGDGTSPPAHGGIR
jgi:hypothetical protein